MSASAASCAARFSVWCGGGCDVFRLVMFDASEKSVLIFPLWKSARRWRMVWAMEVLSRFFLGVGARLRYSRWTKSHQNGADCFEGVELMMALIVFACS